MKGKINMTNNNTDGKFDLYLNGRYSRRKFDTVDDAKKYIGDRAHTKRGWTTKWSRRTKDDTVSFSLVATNNRGNKVGMIAGFTCPKEALDWGRVEKPRAQKKAAKPVVCRNSKYKDHNGDPSEEGPLACPFCGRPTHYDSRDEQYHHCDGISCADPTSVVSGDKPAPAKVKKAKTAKQAVKEAVEAVPDIFKQAKVINHKPVDFVTESVRLLAAAGICTSHDVWLADDGNAYYWVSPTSGPASVVSNWGYNPQTIFVWREPDSPTLASIQRAVLNRALTEVAEEIAGLHAAPKRKVKVSK